MFSALRFARAGRKLFVQAFVVESCFATEEAILARHKALCLRGASPKPAATARRVTELELSLFFSPRTAVSGF